ncbi:MAG: response regulator [Myxococcales bacterium]|nr:MAG: response regulator [Myxococcales bacterium]
MPKTVLIVDDDRGIVDFLSNVLKHEGYVVEAAYDGAQGWDKLRFSPPDLLILDLMMPRMNGLTMFKKMKKEESLRDVPVIMLTAIDNVIEEDKPKDRDWTIGEIKDPFHEKLEKILGSLKAQGETSPEVFLEKPVNREQVMEAIEKALGIP